MPVPKTPFLAADTIIELTDRPSKPIVLIERRNFPHGWALPGGFVDVGERVEQAAIREAAEETGLRVALRLLLGVYSAPDRDPRGHTVGLVFIGEAHGEPQAADDAARIGIYRPTDVPKQLAFDHAQILADYQHFLATGKVAPLRLT